MQIFVYLSLRSYIRSGLGLAVYCKTGGFKVNIVSALGVDYICAKTHTVVNYDRGNVETAGFGAVHE